MPHHFATLKLKGKGLTPPPIAKFLPSPTMPTYMPTHAGMTSDAIKRLEALRPKPLQKQPNIKFNL